MPRGGRQLRFFFFRRWKTRTTGSAGSRQRVSQQSGTFPALNISHTSSRVVSTHAVRTASDRKRKEKANEDTRAGRLSTEKSSFSHISRGAHGHPLSSQENAKGESPVVIPGGMVQPKPLRSVGSAIFTGEQTTSLRRAAHEELVRMSRFATRPVILSSTVETYVVFCEIDHTPSCSALAFAHNFSGGRAGNVPPGPLFVL